MTSVEPVIERLSKDLKTAAATLSPDEARYLVDAYYQIQEYRKAADNQVRSLAKQNEPHAVIEWLGRQNEILEAQLKRALDTWSDTSELGRWAKSITGIGPVISAGLLAHIDITKAPTAGHIWRFAGLDPTVVWSKKTKRPWNASLKTLCWKIGESFVKVSGHPEDFYGQFYLKRKAAEWEKNLAGEFADQARQSTERKTFGETTAAIKWYKGRFDPATVREFQRLEKNLLELPAVENGTPMLPPAQIHARAKRYAVKLFLAHYHDVAYHLHYKQPPPKPYVIEHLGHVHLIGAPNFKPIA